MASPGLAVDSIPIVIGTIISTKKMNAKIISIIFNHLGIKKLLAYSLHLSLFVSKTSYWFFVFRVVGVILLRPSDFGGQGLGYLSANVAVPSKALTVVDRIISKLVLSSYSIKEICLRRMVGETGLELLNILKGITIFAV